MLVEDFLETGKSLLHVVQQLQENGNKIKTFAVGYLEKSLIVPDFFGRMVKEIPGLPWD